MEAEVHILVFYCLKFHTYWLTKVQCIALYFLASTIGEEAIKL
jgi:hypothetical protein